MVPRLAVTVPLEMIGVTPGTDVVAVTFELIFWGRVSVTVTPDARFGPLFETVTV
jgi:hypothetical protein